MKALKKILITLIVIIITLVIISFFLPSKINVERSMVIDCPQEILFDQVNDLYNWGKWSPWHQIDTAMEINYFGPTYGEGAFYEWTSEHPNVGNGKLTITKSIPLDTITTEMDFMEQGTASAYYYFDKTDNGVKVTWGFDTDMGMNPMAKFMGLMMNKWIGKDYEKGLNNLKDICANLPEYYVSIKQLPTQNYVGIRITCPLNKIGTEMGKAYGKLMKTISAANATVAGAPFCIYYEFSHENVDFEAAIPVTGVIQTSGNIVYNILPENKYASTEYWGNYDKLENAHSAIQQWINDRDAMTTGAPIEVYVTDPMAEPDTSKWLTRIYYPFN